MKMEQHSIPRIEAKSTGGSTAPCSADDQDILLLLPIHAVESFFPAMNGQTLLIQVFHISQIGHDPAFLHPDY